MDKRNDGDAEASVSRMPATVQNTEIMRLKALFSEKHFELEDDRAPGVALLELLFEQVSSNDPKPIALRDLVSEEDNLDE
eukprot:953285-Amphidinium_carterae.1